ncbi:hypothetical protein CEXT_629441 [Caerostris extrusa]|uniref:Uncharacterized protein n=1 Tax=Caerostris extrusa TaxID=172846 RepID=A0AAV4TX45_CAEEX|nr:hypothetical protein CEXT_629441 [Caerostris extrusa]
MGEKTAGQTDRSNQETLTEKEMMGQPSPSAVWLLRFINSFWWSLVSKVACENLDMSEFGCQNCRIYPWRLERALLQSFCC